MANLGKIFIYERNVRHLHENLNKLELQGFAAFGTDNLYQLLKYAEQINPDIVIMNLPQEFNANEKTWQHIESSLCQNSCPQIYINSKQKFEHQPSFHYYDFASDEMTQQQIYDILKNLQPQKYLH